MVGFWSMHSLFLFLQNLHPHLLHHSSYSFALQKVCPNSHGYMGLLFLFKHSFLSFSTLNHPPKLRTAFRKILIYGILKDNERKEGKKTPCSLSKQLIMYVEFLLSLCSCFSFLHVWEHRLYPICDPVLCQVKFLFI